MTLGIQRDDRGLSLYCIETGEVVNNVVVDSHEISSPRISAIDSLGRNHDYRGGSRATASIVFVRIPNHRDMRSRVTASEGRASLIREGIERFGQEQSPVSSEASNEHGLPYGSLIEEMERRAGTLRPVPTPQTLEDVARGAQAERTRWLRRGELDARMAEQSRIAERDLTQEERWRARELGLARIRSLFPHQDMAVLEGIQQSPPSVPSEPAKRQTEGVFEFHVTATDCFVEIDEKNDFLPILVDGLDE